MQIPKIPVPKLPTDMDTKFYGNQLFNTTIFKNGPAPKHLRHFLIINVFILTWF